MTATSPSTSTCSSASAPDAARQRARVRRTAAGLPVARGVTLVGHTCADASDSIRFPCVIYADVAGATGTTPVPSAGYRRPTAAADTYRASPAGSSTRRPSAPVEVQAQQSVTSDKPPCQRARPLTSSLDAEDRDDEHRQADVGKDSFAPRAEQARRLPTPRLPTTMRSAFSRSATPDDDVGGRAVLLKLFDPEPDDQPHTLAAPVDDLGATLRADPSPGSEGVGRLTTIRSMHVDHLVAPHCADIVGWNSDLTVGALGRRETLP